MVCFFIEKDRSVFGPAVARLKRTYAAYAKSGELVKLGSIPPPPSPFEVDRGYTRGEMEYRLDGATTDDEEEMGRSRKRRKQQQAQWLVEGVVPKYLRSRKYKQSVKYTIEVCQRKRLRVGPSLISGAGDGLFTEDFIRSGAPICQVEGQFMWYQTVKKSKSNRVVKLDRQVNDIDLYFNMATCNPAAKINDGTHIDAGEDSDVEPYVNCVLVEGGCGVGFNDLNFLRVVATEDIDAGDELYLDYGTTYWARRKYSKRVGSASGDDVDGGGESDGSDDDSGEGGSDEGSESGASDGAVEETEEEDEGEGDGVDGSGVESSPDVEEGVEGKGEREEEEDGREEEKQFEGEREEDGEEVEIVVEGKVDRGYGVEEGNEGKKDGDDSREEGGGKAGEGGATGESDKKMWGKRSVGTDAFGGVVCVVRTPDSMDKGGGPESGDDGLTPEAQKKRRKERKKAAKKEQKKAEKKEAKRLAKANKKKQKKKKKEDKTDRESELNEETQRDVFDVEGDESEGEGGSAAGTNDTPIVLDDNIEEGDSVHAIAKQQRSDARSSRKVRRETDRVAPAKPTQSRAPVGDSGKRVRKGSFFQGQKIFDLESVEEPVSGTAVVTAPSISIEVGLTKQKAQQARALAKLKGHNAGGVTELVGASSLGSRRSGRGRGNVGGDGGAKGGVTEVVGVSGIGPRRSGRRRGTVGGDGGVKEASHTTSRMKGKKKGISDSSNSNSKKKARRTPKDVEDLTADDQVPDCGLCDDNGELDGVRLVECLAHQDDDGWRHPPVCDTCDVSMERELKLLKERRKIDRTDTEFFKTQMKAQNSKGTSSTSAKPSGLTAGKSRSQRTTRSRPSL